MTASHDKTVQLWSLADSYNLTYSNNVPIDPSGLPAKSVGSSSILGSSNVHGLLLLSTSSSSSSATPTGRNTPTGSNIGPSASVARLVYREHRKPVFGALYLPTYRLVASVGGHLILWDPCTGQKVCLKYLQLLYYVALNYSTSVTLSVIQKTRLLR